MAPRRRLLPAGHGSAIIPAAVILDSRPCPNRHAGECRYPRLARRRQGIDVDTSFRRHDGGVRSEVYFKGRWYNAPIGRATFRWLAGRTAHARVLRKRADLKPGVVGAPLRGYGAWTSWRQANGEAKRHEVGRRRCARWRRGRSCGRLGRRSRWVTPWRPTSPH